MPDIDAASGTAASATASRASHGTGTGTNANASISASRGPVGTTSATARRGSINISTNATAGESPSGITVEHSSRSCDGALVRAFSFLGKRWNGVILATLFDGAIGFSELRRAVGAISDSVLSDRLSELCAAGLVERRVFVGPPVAVEYRLTPAGEALLPAMKALSAWSRTNLPA
jgi:DNA-binding HxlR family transcriptional regulator